MPILIRFACFLCIYAILTPTVTCNDNLTSKSWPGEAWRADDKENPFVIIVESTSYKSKFLKSELEQEGFKATAMSHVLHRPGDTNTEGAEVNPFRNFNTFINSFVFPESFAFYLLWRLGDDWAHMAMCYLRNLLSGVVIYYATAGAFHVVVYVIDSEGLFRTGKRRRPTRETIKDQIWLAQRSMFLYVALPVFSDWLIEGGYTYCYYSMEEIGGFGWWLVFTLIYFATVEVGIYWMHRTLHTNKWLYRNVHSRHHMYKTPETLTPWASIAFNPVDGILQVSSG